MPGVDRAALSNAFTRALAPDPDDRFPSCGEFCDALAGAVVPELPLLADVEDFSAEEAPIAAAPITTPLEDPFCARAGDVEDAELMPIDDARSMAEEPVLTSDPSPMSTRSIPAISSAESAAVPSWNPAATASPQRTTESPRFGAVALFLAVIVGAVFGFAAGYMARPRALQSRAASGDRRRA